MTPWTLKLRVRGTERQIFSISTSRERPAAPSRSTEKCSQYGRPGTHESVFGETVDISFEKQ